MTNELFAEPVFVDQEISKFSCYAKTGIGYAFWMRIDFKKPRDFSWHRSDRGQSVTLWFTGDYDISEATGIEEGDYVRLNIEVKVGSNNVKAGQYFIYKKDTGKTAHYEASGSVRNAAVTYKGVKP